MEKQEKKDAILQDYAIKQERTHTVHQLLKAYALFNKDEEYLDALRVRGLETLTRYGGEWKYSGNVIGTRYGTDYLLGDICDIDTRLGVSFSERITSVEFVFENGTVRSTVTFGEGEEPLRSVIKEYVSVTV